MWVPGCLMPVVGECGRRFTLRDVTARYTGLVLRKEASSKIVKTRKMWTEVSDSEKELQTILILDNVK
jgi:hypothetical protein